MTIKEFGDTIAFNIEHNIKHAILGLGAPGVGKSQVIRQIGDKYGYKVIDIRLAQMSEVEIGGLIYPNAERTKTVWLSPDVLPNEERDGPKTILLLDELTSCTKRVQVAAYQLILDRRIGQYELPEGSFVVALGNREDDDGIYIRLASPLADRFEIHYIDVDFNSWKYDYALKNNIHPYVINYLSCKPGSLHTQKNNPDEMVFATPRSWTCVSDILHYDCDVTKPVIRNKIIGNVGANEGRQFVEYCRNNSQKFVSPADFISGKIKKVPDNPETLSMLVDAMISGVNWLRGYNTANEMNDLQRIQLDLTIKAMFRLPRSEYIVLGLTRLLSLNRGIVKQVFLTQTDTNITHFISKNRALLQLDKTI